MHVSKPRRPPLLREQVFAQSAEPPYTDPYVRWCGRGGAARLPPIPIIDPKRPSRLLTNGHSHVAKYWCRKISIALNRLGGRTIEATIQRRTCCSWRSAGHSKASFHKSLVRLKLAESGCPRSSDVRLRL